MPRLPGSATDGRGQPTTNPGRPGRTGGASHDPPTVTGTGGGGVLRSASTADGQSTAGNPRTIQHSQEIWEQ